MQAQRRRRADLESRECAGICPGLLKLALFDARRLEDSPSGMSFLASLCPLNPRLCSLNHGVCPLDHGLCPLDQWLCPLDHGGVSAGPGSAGHTRGFSGHREPKKEILSRRPRRRVAHPARSGREQASVLPRWRGCNANTYSMRAMSSTLRNAGRGAVIRLKIRSS